MATSGNNITAMIVMAWGEKSAFIMCKVYLETSCSASAEAFVPRNFASYKKRHPRSLEWRLITSFS